MTTLLEHKTTLAYLAYLGYPGETTRALKISKTRKQDFKSGKSSRDVLLAFVFGSLGSGKSSLLRKHLKLRISDMISSNMSNKFAVNSVETNGIEKYLVVRLLIH